MTAKEYLKQIKKTSKRLVALGGELEEIRLRKDGLMGITFSEKVKASSTYHNNLDDLITQEEEILIEQESVKKEWRRCRELINKIECTEYSDVLRYYYLLNYDTWAKVADKMHVSERSVYLFHKTAIKEFEKIFNLK